jgi:hypothetical protein
MLLLDVSVQLKALVPEINSAAVAVAMR